LTPGVPSPNVQSMPSNGRPEEARARATTRAIILCFLLLVACVSTQRGPQLRGEATVGGTCIDGYFEGTSRSGSDPPASIALNLRCARERFDGDAFTAGGSFGVLSGSFDGSRLEIDLGEDHPIAALEATVDGERLSGDYRIEDERGTFELVRVGPSRPPPHLDLPPDDWREDLRFIRVELPRRHKNAFHFVTRERFEAEIDALDKRIPEINSDAVFAGLMRIVNLIGDGHTGLRLPRPRPMFGLELRRFGEEYRVVAASQKNARALGGRVVAIDDTAIDEARHLLWALTPQDETPALCDLRVDGYLNEGLLLHGLGIIADPNVAHYHLVDETGAESTLDVRAQPPTDPGSWIRKPDRTPLYLDRLREPFWFAFLPASNAMYVAFRGYADLGTHAKALFEALAKNPVDRLVIDMRLNGGGDNTEGLKHLVEPISKLERINRRGHLFVLIGPETYSAAMNNAAHFRQRTSAILVGEPIGEKPNSYQEPREVKLPRSGLILRASTEYYAFAKEGENVIRPDQMIVASWQDFESGKDPVLDWVLAMPERSPARIFEFHSGMWINLHQELLHYARNDWNFHRLLPERSAAPAFGDALAAYRSRFSRIENLDPVLFKTAVERSQWKSDSSPPIDNEIREPLLRAAEAYRSSHWPKDDARNRAWIERVTPLVERWGAEMADEIARANEATWPKEPIRVEVVTFVDPFGAQTNGPPPMTLISSVDPGYTNDASLEMLFHEASHLFDDRLRDGIIDVCRELHVRVPEGLWHAVLFYTAGYFAKRHLGPTYVMYGDAQGVFKRGGFDKYRPVIADVWEAHLRQEISMRSALREMVKRLSTR
jgi:hypothetical protein